MTSWLKAKVVRGFSYILPVPEAADSSDELGSHDLQPSITDTRIIAKFQALVRASLGGHKELRLLVTGKTGEGKSTLVNGILGMKVATEGAGSERCTTGVKGHKIQIEGVPITVFDSPGLQDGTENEDEYVADMKKKCQNLSLVLYCSKMTNHRLRDEDKNAVLRLTREFGQKFWEHAVLVLTFANMEIVSRRDDRDEDKGPEPDDNDDDGWKELKKKRFEGRLEKWKDGFYKFLTDEVGIKRKIVQRILVVPAGDHRVIRDNKEPYRLPDRDDWFIEFWKACSLRVKEINLFFKINKSRIVIETPSIVPSSHPHLTTSSIDELTTVEEEGEEVFVDAKDFNELTLGEEGLLWSAMGNQNNEEPSDAQDYTFLSDTPADDSETYTAKLQENLQKKDKEAWVKDMECKVERLSKEVERVAEELRKTKEKMERQIEENRKALERQAEENKVSMEKLAKKILQELEHKKQDTTVHNCGDIVEERVSANDEERVSTNDEERVSTNDEKRFNTDDEERFNTDNEERFSPNDEERVSPNEGRVQEHTHEEIDDNLIVGRQICLNEAHLQEVVEESLYRKYGREVARLAKKIWKKITAPAVWLMSLF
ncbi:PREDICTED: uncharacterized protein LOC109584520 [Amphimedon queenslandica]|uniref:AIG1-type G domain-containing protein n=1 Tax=Amphimedon queenslandica TaxID=400682 RepID=A0A1X7U7S7_AMPQE|nr:PREDICTED: uncharacterized protein LOC109584520 [Amphimedon queenslandica]|eukprot:XP_019855843.1 PREDICTED: uncharacterized protein LOC109584520 [Amphimedon queenslandica]